MRTGRERERESGHEEYRQRERVGMRRTGREREWA